MGEFGIGQPVPRTEDPRLLRGNGRYGDDIKLPGQAYGYFLRSPHAHAKILKIDTEAAKAAPGVLLVLTGADWDKTGYTDFPVLVPRQKRDGTPMGRAPRKGADRRPRAHGRRRGGVRGRRDAGAGEGCRRD